MQLKPEKPSKTRLQSKIQNRKSTAPYAAKRPTAGTAIGKTIRYRLEEVDRSLEVKE